MKLFIVTLAFCSFIILSLSAQGSDTSTLWSQTQTAIAKTQTSQPTNTPKQEATNTPKHEKTKTPKPENTKTPKPEKTPTLVNTQTPPIVFPTKTPITPAATSTSVAQETNAPVSNIPAIINNQPVQGIPVQSTYTTIPVQNTPAVVSTQTFTVPKSLPHTGEGP